MENKPRTIEWEAPEYEHQEKTADWFWAVGIITIALVVASAIYGNFLFAILAGLMGFTISLYGARKPETVKFSIGPRGIRIGSKLYDYENLNSFWVEYNPPFRKELILESKKTLMPHINIMLRETDPEDVRGYLSQFMVEKKIEESLIATVAKIIGF